MVDPFIGTWKIDSSENFDEYMKALGVGLVLRNMGNLAKPNLIISMDEQGMITMKSQSKLKTTEITFKLNEEFDETTADDRKTKTVMSLENGKLVQKQTWDGKTTTIERSVEDGVMTTAIYEPRENKPHLCPEYWTTCNKGTCILNDVVAVRKYVKDA